MANSTTNIAVTASAPVTYTAGVRQSVWIDTTTNQLCYVKEDGTTACMTMNTGIPLYYGSFFDTTAQPIGAINTAQAMRLNTTDLSSGVTVVTDGTYLTRITAANTGIYNVQFSAQIQKTSGGGEEEVTIWLAKNGTAIPDSSTSITLANNGHLNVAAWNWFVSLTAGQYVQIMWASTTLNMELARITSSPPGPDIPSVIATMNRVG